MSLPLSIHLVLPVLCVLSWLGISDTLPSALVEGCVKGAGLLKGEQVTLKS